MLGEYQPQVNQYAQDINCVEYIACINNNHNPSVDRDGLNSLQSSGSSSSSSGNFPENKPHIYEAPTQVAKSFWPVREEVPTQPPVQVANELLHAFSQVCSRFLSFCVEG